MIKLDDIISYFSAAAAFNLKKRYRVFADYSDVTIELSNDDIYEMVQRRKLLLDTNERIRIAIYCKENYVFGLGRMYGALLGEDKYNVMVFRSQEEAKVWLGI
ncbi:MAG: hypothetical protein SWH54_20060 [Thermodesulfobacteriota bacterium]|nr:hypothetical protein [Thermodesulfobacteriota bacterium]